MKPLECVGRGGSLALLVLTACQNTKPSKTSEPDPSQLRSEGPVSTIEPPPPTPVKPATPDLPAETRTLPPLPDPLPETASWSRSIPS
jgi:hypothetical protein